nr:hypothetical protein BgiMline_027694 [Biomphalaria glabrata]
MDSVQQDGGLACARKTCKLKAMAVVLVSSQRGVSNVWKRLYTFSGRSEVYIQPRGKKTLWAAAHLVSATSLLRRGLEFMGGDPEE